MGTTAGIRTGTAADQPAWLARIHAASFQSPRPWTGDEFALMLGSPRHLVLLLPEAALAVVQVVADEAELLTIAVDPAVRRAGLGAQMLRAALSEAAARGAARMFLDVAADNAAALALYSAAGFAVIGRRSGYYRHGDQRIDALLMERALAPPGRTP